LDFHSLCFLLIDLFQYADLHFPHLAGSGLLSQGCQVLPHWLQRSVLRGCVVFKGDTFRSGHPYCKARLSAFLLKHQLLGLAGWDILLLSGCINLLDELRLYKS
ncbi:MAG: hypothetical protein ACRD5H_13440, partial [Nitrososphaerales archaeon]